VLSSGASATHRFAIRPSKSFDGLAADEPECHLIAQAARLHPSEGTARMKAKAILILVVAIGASMSAAASKVVPTRVMAHAATSAYAESPQTAAEVAAARRRDDFAAMKTYRPGYPFWQHVFTLPDHTIAYGSAKDGRLLVLFPTKGEWTRRARWTDPSLAHLLDGQQLVRKVGDRRDQVAELLARAAGPVVHNSTRGDALLPNARRYGAFLGEWAAIYDRFGVPPDIGLAQVILESGLSPQRRSEANAMGFCQWLQKNWKRLNHFSPTPIDGRNQTTQAPYCAAYLSVLATKYGSFIPALSEHNAGGTNVGRTLINGERMGATDIRTKYMRGSQLARDLRALPGKSYEDIYGSYGPRSYLYAEMVFGNTFIVNDLMASTPQEAVYAMRAPRALSLVEIVKRTGLSVDEVRRFNPALVDRVPAQSALYLPAPIGEFGADIAFWRRPAPTSYVAVLNDFMRLESGPERWDDPSFARVLSAFRQRFQGTKTEEGAVMDTVLAYVMDQAYTSRRRELVTGFRGSEQVRRLVDRGRLELGVVRDAQARMSLQ
jgi:hypothetical protein